MEKVTPDKVLKDPDFYQLPEFERIKVLEKIDPDFKSLPKEEKLKVVTAFAGKSKDELQKLFVKEAPIYEKAWRQFAHGSGQLFKTAGELINKVTYGLTSDPLMQAQIEPYVKKVGNTVKELGTEAQDYWKADEYQNKFHGLGGEIVNALIRETPSLIAFNPVMKTTGSLAMSALSPKSRVAKSIVESLGTGAGYTAVNLAGRENYDLKDAAIDSTIDFGVGFASPYVAKGIKTISKRVDPFFEKITSELKSLFKIAKKAKHKEATIKIAEAYRSAKKGEKLKILEATDELLNRDDIPVPVKRKAAEIQNKIKEDLPEPVKEAGAESTDAYVDLKLSKDEIREVRKELKEFRQRLKNIENEQGIIFVTKPKTILKKIGFPDNPITINKKTIKRKLKKHSIELEDLKNLPAKINNPVLVYKKPDSKNVTVITSQTTPKGILLTAIELNVRKPNIGIEVNDIRSVYYKDWNGALNQLKKVAENGEILFINKKKATTLLTGRGAPIAPGFSQSTSELFIS